MSKTTLAECQARIKELQAARDMEISALEAALPLDAEAIRKADEALETATVNNDIEAFSAAKDAKRNALDMQEMHRRRLDAFRTRPQIQPDEYKKISEELLKDAAEKEEALKKKLVKLYEEAAGAGQSLKEYEIQINEALRALQSDLNRDADRPKSSEGKPISGTETRVTMNRSIEWSRAGLRMTQYKEVTGVETEEREAKKWI